MIVLTLAKSGPIFLWRHCCSKNNEQWEGKNNVYWITSNLNVLWLFVVHLFASILHYPVQFSPWDSQNSLNVCVPSTSLSVVFPTRFWCVPSSLGLRNPHLGRKSHVLLTEALIKSINIQVFWLPWRTAPPPRNTHTHTHTLSLCSHDTQAS